MRIVIVGAGAAGLTLASNIRKNDKNTELMVFTENEEIAYSPCAIPLVLGGKIASFDEIIMHDVNYYSEKNIEIHLSTKVCNIDSTRKNITYEKNSKRDTVDYDKLVLATGTEVISPDYDIEDMTNIFSLSNINDGRIIEESVKNKKSITFISNLSIGIESAYELSSKGYDVRFLEESPSLLPLFLDHEMSEKLVELNSGVTFETNVKVTSITQENDKKVIHYNDKSIVTDMVILPSYKIPSTYLAKKAGCELGNFAVKVNEYLETSVMDVYAIGDCIEVKNHITDSQTMSPSGSNAVRQAIILSNTLTGNKMSFSPVVNTVVSNVGNYNYAAAGITESFAGMNDVEVVSEYIETCQKARYYPDNNKLFIKMITRHDGTVVGCQMISKSDLSGKIDLMSFIIKNNLSCEDIIKMEFSYSPSMAMVINPLVQIASQINQKLISNDK